LAGWTVDRVGTLLCSRNLVTEEPTRDQQLRTHVITTPVETMVRFDPPSLYSPQEIRLDIAKDGGEEQLVTLCRCPARPVPPPPRQPELLRHRGADGPAGLLLGGAALPPPASRRARASLLARPPWARARVAAEGAAARRGGGFRPPRPRTGRVRCGRGTAGCRGRRSGRTSRRRHRACSVYTSPGRCCPDYCWGGATGIQCSYIESQCSVVHCTLVEAWYKSDTFTGWSCSI
jgi:hypothetical protein